MAKFDSDMVWPNGDRIRPLIEFFTRDVDQKNVAAQIDLGARMVTFLKLQQRCVRFENIRKLHAWLSDSVRMARLKKEGLVKTELEVEELFFEKTPGGVGSEVPEQKKKDEHRPRHLPEKRPWPVVGRDLFTDNIKDLLNIAVDDQNPHGTILLHGSPGMGKSALLEQFAHDPDNDDAFDVILWTQLGPSPDVDKRLEEWRNALRVPFEEYGRDRTFALRSHLKNRIALLLIDDVWRLDHLLPFVTIGHADTVIVMTSRMKRLEDGFLGFAPQSKELPPLDEEAALAILKHHAEPEIDKNNENCRKLVKVLGCLPLSIHVAGQIIKSARKNKGSDEIEKLLENPETVLRSKIPSDAPPELAGQTVAGLLELSVQLLRDQHRECFARMGILGPRKKFTVKNLQLGPSINASDVLRTLADLGLVECVNAEKGVYRMHALLVLYADYLKTRGKNRE
jgi:hypothetical protein